MEPRTIVNGLTGETVTFGKYGEDERGAYLELLTVTLPAGSEGPPLHSHPFSDEEGEVVAGRVRLFLGSEMFDLGPGESLTIPRGVPHRWENAGDETLVIRGIVRTPGSFEQFLTTVCTLANTGRMTTMGRPGLLQSAVLLSAHRDTQTAEGVPRPMRLALRLLAPVARWRGYRSPLDYVPPQGAYPGMVVESGESAPAYSPYRSPNFSVAYSTK